MLLVGAHDSLPLSQALKTLRLMLSGYIGARQICLAHPPVLAAYTGKSGAAVALPLMILNQGLQLCHILASCRPHQSSGEVTTRHPSVLGGLGFCRLQ